MQSYQGFTQDRYRVGTLPSININRGFQDRYAFNFNWQSRQIYRSGTLGEDGTTDFSYTLNDLTFIGSKKVGLNNTIAVGYLLRFDDSRIVHRSIQQFIVVSRYSKFRLAHRISTDQTFEQDDKTEFRIRYRLSTEIPLNGQSADRNEFYLKVNNEYLNSWQDSDYDLELRLIPMLGRIIRQQCKMELGIDYRVNSFIESGSNHTFWVALNVYIKI